MSEIYIVKKAKSLTGEGLQPQLAGYKNKVYKHYAEAVTRAEMVAKASGNEMLVFKAISVVKPIVTTTTSVERLL